MIAQLLAQAPTADPMISGQWLLSVIPILASGAALIAGRSHWKSVGAKEAASGDVTIRKPVPTIETREKPVWASKSDLDALASKHELNIHNVHRRLDDQVKSLARMEGAITGTHETVGKLLDIALGKKTTPRQ